MTTTRAVNWAWRLPREPVSIRVAVLLTDCGHDALHVTDCDLAGEPDERVLARAVEDGRVLLSADTEFG
jgi:predicted nuclease of predicted toxin-antitoxin system